MKRFWSKVKVTDDLVECWIWTAATLPKGYGYFRVDKEHMEQAHRVAYRLTYGAIPSGLCVLHSCDNRPCCNPGHLFLGTRATNNADCKAKGRNNVGVRNGNSRLTPEIVAQIRAEYVQGRNGYQRLGKKFGVSLWNIREIVKGRTWVS